MKLNFYSKLIIVLITMIPHCFSTALSDVDTSKFNSVTARKESASVAAGRSLIQDADEARCVQYNKSPGGFKEYRLHTAKIDHFLANAHVKEDEAASDEMIRAIVTAAIDKEITHYGDKSLKRTHSPVKAKRDELGEGHRLYNHYHVLSLIEDAAALFVKGKTNIFTSYKYELFSNNSYLYELISNNADSIYAQIERINSRINKQVFTDCLSITYKNHKRGIAAVKRKAGIDEAAASCGDSPRRLLTHAKGSVTTLKKAHPAAEAKVDAPAAAKEEETAPVDTAKAAALSAASATRLLTPAKVVPAGKGADTVDIATGEKDSTSINPGVVAEDAPTSELVTETNLTAVAHHVDTQELIVEDLVVESKDDDEETGSAEITAKSKVPAAATETEEDADEKEVTAANSAAAVFVEDEDTVRLNLEREERELQEQKDRTILSVIPVKPVLPVKEAPSKSDHTGKKLSNPQKKAAKSAGKSPGVYATELNDIAIAQNKEKEERFARELQQYTLDLAAYDDAMSAYDAAFARLSTSSATK